MFIYGKHYDQLSVVFDKQLVSDKLPLLIYFYYPMEGYSRHHGFRDWTFTFKDEVYKSDGSYTKYIEIFPREWITKIYYIHNLKNMRTIKFYDHHSK